VEFSSFFGQERQVKCPINFTRVLETQCNHISLTPLRGKHITTLCLFNIILFLFNSIKVEPGTYQQVVSAGFLAKMYINYYHIQIITSLYLKKLKAQRLANSQAAICRVFHFEDRITSVACPV